MPLSRLLNGLPGRGTETAAPEPSDLDPGQLFEDLVAALPDSLKWEWDERFNGVLAAFESAEKDAVLGEVTSRFGEPLDRRSIKSASRGVKSAIKELGGVSTGQLVFVADLSRDVMLLGLWWPWRDGETVSVRFIPFGQQASAGEIHAVRAAMMDAFGF
mgnify:CR=1 FL=1